MKNYPSIILTILLLSCSSGQKNQEIERQLIGQWELEKGNWESTRMEKLEFKIDNEYSNEWWNGDVGNTFTGRYFVNFNPRRGLRTVTFIPDLQFADGDSIRINYQNFDIIELDEKKLKVIYATKFVPRDSADALRITVRQIYNRVR